MSTATQVAAPTQAAPGRPLGRTARLGEANLLVIRYATEYLALFGPAYRDSAPIVRTLAAAMLLATGCGMVDMVLTMAGRTAWNLTNVLVALAMMIGIDVVLIPRHGALGAAIGLACAVAVNNLAPLTQIMLHRLRTILHLPSLISRTHRAAEPNHS